VEASKNKAFNETFRQRHDRMQKAAEREPPLRRSTRAPKVDVQEVDARKQLTRASNKQEVDAQEPAVRWAGAGMPSAAPVGNDPDWAAALTAQRPPL
jgi:hypothetical protein